MLFRIDENQCVSCWACQRYCPVDAIPWTLQIRIIEEKCVGCTVCYAVCPVDAIIPVESLRYPAHPDLAWLKMDRVRRRVIEQGPINSDGKRERRHSVLNK